MTTEWYRYRHDWHDASGDHHVVTVVRHAAADASNSPRTLDGDRDCVLVRWYRAGRTAVDFGDHDVVLDRTTDPRTVNVDDWANPDDYWANGKLASWHADFVARFGAQAVACFVTDTGERLTAHPAFHLGDLVATCAAIDAHGASADGLAVTSPATVAIAADWYPGLRVCEDDLHFAVRHTDAWCHDGMLEIVRTSDTDRDETVVVTLYDRDVAWAMTQAKLEARRYADARREPASA